MQPIWILPCGDSAVTIEFENSISESVHAKVSVAAKMIRRAKIVGVQELIPTYRALMVCYNPSIIDYFYLVKELTWILEHFNVDQKPEKKVIEIPVCYGGEFGEDLENVAKHNHLSVSEVVKIHQKPYYLIYMLGFTPGFPYLGGMDKRIATPRLANPRIKIAAGSVGIAGEQTGLYPIDSPGGWQIIGRTPLSLYDPHREIPILLKASQHIKFRSIEPEEFREIRQQVLENSKISNKKI